MPNNFYKLRHSLVVRLEYFGGLIIDTQESAYYQIPEYDAIILFCLNFSKDISLIETTVKNTFNIRRKKFDIRLYESEGFIVRCNRSTYKSKCDLVKVCQKLKESLLEIHKINHLYSPLNVTLYPDFRCQARCKFCYVSKYCDNSNTLFSLQNTKRLIKRFEKLQIPYVSILGGEPLLLPYLKDLLPFMGKRKIIFTITTNAWLLSDDLIKIIDQYDNINLSISLQSVDNFHSQATGLDYNKVVQNIKLAKGHCRINTVYTGQTFEQLEKLIDFVASEKIKSLTLVVYNNIYLSQKEQIDNHLKFLNAKNHVIKYIKSKHYNIDFRAEGCMQYLFEQKVNIIPETEIEKIFTKCEAGNLKLEVLPNGDTIGCTALDSDHFKSGNIFKNDILKIWNSDSTINKLRSCACQDKECLQCKYYAFCNGGCPAQRYLVNNNFEKVRDIRCLKKI